MMSNPTWQHDPVSRLACTPRSFGEYGGVNASVEVSTTFTVMEASTLSEIFQGRKGAHPDKGGCFLYARSLSPTVEHLSRQLAAIEGTEAAYCTASGMAAIACTLLAICNAGDHIVASNAIYGGSFALLKTFLPMKCGITVTFVNVCDLAAVERAFQPDTKVLYTETLSNPTLQVADVPALAQLAHARGCQLVADNTFTPLVVSPAKWGADVVIHSLTKFVSGASDVMAGVACGSAAFVRSLMDLHSGPAMLMGPTLDAMTASLLSRRLANLSLRMTEHSRRALAMAQALERWGARVNYPGLPSHAGFELMCKLVNPHYGFGGVIAVDMKTAARASRLSERLQNVHAFGFMAVSLGYFDTLMSISSISTSSELGEEDLAAAGVSPGLLRLSIGYTGTLEQRLEQLEEAYKAIVDGDNAMGDLTAVQAVSVSASDTTSSPKSSSEVQGSLTAPALAAGLHKRALSGTDLADSASAGKHAKLAT